MNRGTRLALCALVLAATAHAQNVFVAFDGDSPKMVKEVRFNRAFVEKDGKLAAASTARFVFAPGLVYRPGVVTMSDLRVSVSHVETTSGDQFNYELHIQGRAQSDTTFKKCFMVPEMTAWKTHGVAVTEVPDLPAGERVDLDLTFHLADKIEEGSYRLHLYSDGIEILHTKMPEAYVATQKKKTTEILAGKTQDWPPVLAYATKPAYPEALKKSKVAGSARVRLHVAKNGEVSAPELIGASEPAFGEAALAAVLKWKFDPAVKERKFAEATLEVPIEFRPPK